MTDISNTTYRSRAVQNAVYRARDEILAVLDCPEESSIPDALNLMADAALVYLDCPNAELRDVVALCVDDGDYEETIEWFRTSIA